MNRSALDLKLTGYILFLLAVLLCIAFPNFWDTGIPTSGALVVIDGIILFGLWRGLARTDFAAPTRLAVWLAVAVPYTLWTAAVWGLAVRGTFDAVSGANQVLPALPVAIFLPAVAGAVLLTRSRHIASVLDVTPPSWLVGLQVYRVLGALFLAGWARGTLPGSFALPAGIGDIVVGLLALPAARRVSANSSSGRRIGIYWNLLGLADFAVAVSMGWLTSPGPAQVFALDHPNAQLSTFPTVMVPAFAVPSSIILHVLSLWQLRRAAMRTVDAGTFGSHGLSTASSVAS